MKLRLSAPSKTFLLGEYLVLTGGSALIVNTKPRFSLQADSSGRGQVEGIHPSSPAGKLINAHQEIFSRWDLEFSDAHEGLGGFGASSSQFLFAYSIYKFAMEESGGKEFSLRHLWETYREYSDSGSGLPPSGADVLAQATGGLTRVQMSPFDVGARRWPFDEHGFFVVRTGHKVPTHQHLKSIDDIETPRLQAAFDLGLKSLGEKNPVSLASAITDYQKALKEMGLVAQETYELVEALDATEAVEAVKGCGALGADVLFVLFAKRNEAVVRDRLSLLGLQIVASEKDVALGLKITAEKGRGSRRGVSL